MQIQGRTLLVALMAVMSSGNDKHDAPTRALRGINLPFGNNAKIASVSVEGLQHVGTDINAASQKVVQRKGVDDVAAEKSANEPTDLAQVAPSHEVSSAAKAAEVVEAARAKAVEADVAATHVDVPPSVAKAILETSTASVAERKVSAKLGADSASLPADKFRAQITNKAMHEGQLAHGDIGDVAHRVERAESGETKKPVHTMSASLDDLERNTVLDDAQTEVGKQESAFQSVDELAMKLQSQEKHVPSKATDVVAHEVKHAEAVVDHIKLPPKANEVSLQLASVKASEQLPFEATNVGQAAESTSVVSSSTGQTSTFHATRKEIIANEEAEPWHHRLHRHHRETRGFAFTSFVVHVLVLFSVAYIVRTYVPQPLPQSIPAERDPEIGRAAFAFGLFDEKESWGNDKWLCFFSCCCLGIRWAETLTNHKVQLANSFWILLAVSLLATHELKPSRTTKFN